MDDAEFLELPRWQLLDSRLDDVNQLKAVIICGGPGYSRNFYLGVYPLVGDLAKIHILIINRHGIENVLMTGCPTWYHLENLDVPFKRPEKIGTMAISMVQNKLCHPQNLDVLRRLKGLIDGSYGNVRYIAVFHRGLEGDDFTQGGVKQNAFASFAGLEKVLQELYRTMQRFL